MGVQKPDPRVFHFALRRAGVNPSDALFIGDSWKADNLGARGAGLSAVWPNRADELAPSPCRQIRTLKDLPALLFDPSLDG